MIAEKILKQITPKIVKKEIKKIEKVKLPNRLQGWVRKYKQVGGRDDFIWKWSYIGWQIFTLSCVSKKYQVSVVEIKTCNTILNTLIDDIVDKRKNNKMLTAILNILLNPDKNQNLFLFNKKDRKYLALIKGLWKFIQMDIKTYPRYKEFKDIFYYDIRQFLNTALYSQLINTKQEFINLVEHEAYSHHNMQGMVCLDIDLMCSPTFDIKEAGLFREVSWITQQMGRIDNLIVTWQKEIYENDFTSGVFAYSIKNNIIKVDDLKKSKEMVIKQIQTSRTEEYFLKQWEDYYKKLTYLAKSIHSVNIRKIIKGHEKFLNMHLISRGLEI